MSIQNYTQQDLTLANLMELPKSINFHIMTIDQLPLRPIISNIGTGSYHLSKYLLK